MITLSNILFVSSTLGDCRLEVSLRSTLGAWLAVSDTLGGDAVVRVSAVLGGRNIFFSCAMASLVLSPWSRNGVFGCGFCSTAMRSCAICVSRSSDEVSGISTWTGKNSTVLLTLTPLVFGM